MLDPVAMRELGFTYEGIGRATVGHAALVRQSFSSRAPAPGCGALTDRTQRHAAARRPAAACTYTFEHLRRHGVTRARSCRAVTSPTQIQEHFGDRYGDAPALSTRSRRSRSAPAARSASQRRRDSTGRSSRSTATRCAKPTSTRSSRFHRECPSAHDPADARRGSDPATGSCGVNGDGQRAKLPREAAPGGDRHQPDQRGHATCSSADVLDLIPRGLVPVSIEREVFPLLVEEQAV